MSYIQNIHPTEAFDKRHGDFAVIDRTVYFADGACREKDVMGALIEPPTDPWERAKRVAIFHGAILQNAIDKFDTFRQQLIWQEEAAIAQGFGGVSKQDLARVEELRKRVIEFKRKHDKALANIEAAKPEAMKIREKSIAESMARSQGIISDLIRLQV